MVPHPPPSGERQTNGKSGPSAGNGRVEKAPGTPRREAIASKPKALQDPGLKDYVSVREVWSHHKLLTPGPHSVSGNASAREHLDRYTRHSIGGLVKR